MPDSTDDANHFATVHLFSEVQGHAQTSPLLFELGQHLATIAFEHEDGSACRACPTSIERRLDREVECPELEFLRNMAKIIAETQP